MLRMIIIEIKRGDNYILSNPRHKGERAMSKSKWTLQDLPPATSSIRKKILNFTNKKEYQKEIKSGLPFFSDSELRSIENKFKEIGMTRKDIMSIIYKKGWLIKENTLKHYLQKDQLPRATKRIKTNKGMISLYPATIIRHLNFVRYCLFSKNKDFDLLISILKDVSNDDFTLIEAASIESDEYGFDGDDCFQALWIGISRLNETGIPWVKESIEKAFANQKIKKDRYLKKLNEIEKIVNELERKIDGFIEILKKNKTLIGLDELKAFFLQTQNKGE